MSDSELPKDFLIRGRILLNIFQNQSNLIEPHLPQNLLSLILGLDINVNVLRNSQYDFADLYVVPLEFVAKPKAVTKLATKWLDEYNKIKSTQNPSNSSNSPSNPPLQPSILPTSPSPLPLRSSSNSPSNSFHSTSPNMARSAHEGEEGDEGESSTPQHLNSQKVNEYLREQKQFYKDEGVQDIRLWQYFQEDFGNWTEDTFKKGSNNLLRSLRDQLCQNGCFVPDPEALESPLHSSKLPKRTLLTHR
jgi:hypothetical protein